MDWNNRAPRLGQPASQPAAQQEPTNHTSAKQKKGRGLGPKFEGLRLATVILFASVGILLVALVGYVAYGGTPGEVRYVDDNKMQAVFLNGGQVYFGRIKALNNKFMRIDDIYYLRVNQQVQPDQNSTEQSDISLVKLGCELHGPQDMMIVNREHVIFWENLKEDGQVAKAVEEYKKQNPEGQKCEEPQPQSNNQNNDPSAPAPNNNTENNNGSTEPLE